MRKYIATFFSHYDALSFFDALKGKNIPARLMPVPRKLSASCGTCVEFSSDLPASEIDFAGCELEAFYTETESGFSKL